MTESIGQELDAGARAQVAEFLRMTPAERLRSLVSTVTFIQRARLRMRSPAESQPSPPDRSGP